MRVIIGLLAGLLCATGAHAQVFDVQQLLLDVEKLGQLKLILQDLKQGYQLLDAGYSAIRDVAHGNFNLHEVYLDGLLAVSPSVRKYQRVIDITTLQLRIVGSYQRAWAFLRQRGGFRPAELELIGQVYNGLLADASKDLDDLLVVVTDGVLRAGDAERLREIDAIYSRMVERLGFLERFNDGTALLAQQRQGQVNEDKTLENLYNLK